MKKQQLREMSIEELKAKLAEDIETLSNLRFQKALQQLENPAKIRQIKKEIAQIKTVLREYELGIRKKKES
ncbi:MAG: 50S ribosomal protein L29 [Candidatus Marinimicrobia bacterium]|nr:50S ribosomal protein L29 [Candidatus Neomarinimicrobiota bacterium]